MSPPRDRLKRERHTIEVMIGIYCRGHRHTEKALCPDCQNLLTYAMQRIDKCPFRAEKPVCAQCTIHCYKADMRERVRRVMRYAGPRMMLYHPLLALGHKKDQITGRAKKNEKSET